MENKKKKTRKFKARDRVMVIGYADDYLQRNNRIGTVKKLSGDCAYLKMDKKVKEDAWYRGKVKIADGYCYYAYISELEKIKLRRKG